MNETHEASALSATFFVVCFCFLVSGLAACSGGGDGTTGARTPPPMATIASAQPRATQPGAPAPSSTPLPEDYSAWTNPLPLAELAKDCAWEPPAPPRDTFAEYAPPLRCEREPAQVCQQANCLGIPITCYPECAQTCEACGGACVSACESCKRACGDEACRGACAQGCAECRQSCVRDLDHCTSGHCGELMAECGKAELAEWKKARCEDVCPRMQTCADDCPVDQRFMWGPCMDACEKKWMNASCPTEWVNVCLGRAQSPADLWGQP